MVAAMKFSFAADGKPLAAADHLLVIGSKTCFGPRAPARAALTGWLGGSLGALAQKLGHEAVPGLLGGLATSRTAADKRLTVAALPDTPSRHTAPSRAEGIRKVTAAAGLGAAGKYAVLLLLDDAEHVLPAVNAVGRALPTFTAKSNGKAAGTLALACTLRNGDALPVDAATRDVVELARHAAHLVDTPP